MADLERFDPALLGVAQQVSAAAAPGDNPIDTLLDIYFGFLRRKTDFFRRVAAGRLARAGRRKNLRVGARFRRDALRQGSCATACLCAAAPGRRQRPACREAGATGSQLAARWAEAASGAACARRSARGSMRRGGR